MSGAIRRDETHLPFPLRSRDGWPFRVRVSIALLWVLSAACRHEPRVVGDGTLSLPSAHEGPSAFDPASGSLYFTRASEDFSESRVYRAVWGSADEPALALFSTGRFDAGASIDPTAGTVVFTSQRASDNPDHPDAWNLWSTALGDPEAAATPLPAPINSPASECCAVYGGDGSLLFSSDRDGSWDVFRARPSEDGTATFTLTKLAGSINSEHDEWPSYVSPDGSLILFSSIRPGGPGGDDIFAACLVEPDPERWEAHRLPAPVNTEAYEDSALIAPGLATLLWSSRRARPGGGGLADIYRLELGAAGLPECAP